MHRSRRSWVADRYLWNVGGTDHLLDHGGHRATEDAMGTRIFGMQWCIVQWFPGRVALGLVVAVDVAVADGSHWPPEQIVPFCFVHRLDGISLGNGHQGHKSRRIDD